jgi:hypothetical protein
MNPDHSIPSQPAGQTGLAHVRPTQWAHGRMRRCTLFDATACTLFDVDWCVRTSLTVLVG